MNSSAKVEPSPGVWCNNHLYKSPPEGASTTEQTVISTTSLVISDYQNNPVVEGRPGSGEGHLSDYENNPTGCPLLGGLSKSSSTSSTTSLNICSFNRSSHSLSSTSLCSVNLPLFQPIEYAVNPHYSFYTSDCEDHSDYVPPSFPRSLTNLRGTPSPLISRPSSPLPPTPSPNYSRSPSPSRSSRFRSSIATPPTWASCSAPYTRSLNGSREASPLRLRPSTYTRPLSPNPPTVSPGMSSANRPTVRSRPSSPSQSLRHPITPTPRAHHLSMRSPPSPTRPAPLGAPSRAPCIPRSPVTSRPPSPLNSRQHALLVSAVRPARSQSQPPGSHRLHSRPRSTRTPSPRPPRPPSSAPLNPQPPPPPPPTSPLPNPGKRHSRMRAR